MYNLNVTHKGKNIYHRKVSNGIALGVFALCVFGGVWLFEVLWNYVVPALFNGPRIGYWMSFCIIALLGFFKNPLHISRQAP